MQRAFDVRRSALRIRRCFACEFAPDCYFQFGRVLVAPDAPRLSLLTLPGHLPAVLRPGDAGVGAAWVGAGNRLRLFAPHQPAPRTHTAPARPDPLRSAAANFAALGK